MLRFAFRKTVHFVLLLAAVAALAFALASASPVDPVNAYVGADQMRVGPEQRAAIAARWGLDKPPAERFARWLGNVARGDWGESLIHREPVTTVIARRFWPSLALMGGAWILSGFLGFGLGLIAGLHRGGWTDRLISGYAYLLASTPTFWLGILLLTLFSVQLGWAPICCATPPGVPLGDATLAERLYHLMLPVATLSVVGVAAVVMHTRRKTIDVLKTDFAVFSLAQGETRGGFVLRQGFPHIAIPALTVHLASFGELFGGSILAEQVFSYPGLGKAAVDAGIRQDIPLLLGIALASAVFIFAGNLLADILHRRLDPRLRTEGAPV